MTKPQFGRDLERIQLALEQLELDQRGWTRASAMRRVVRGERRSADLALLGEEFAGGWEEQFMADLPSAILARSRRGGWRPQGDPGSILRELAAHVPGEALSDSCKGLLAEARSGCRAPEFEVCLYWAPIRHIFGDDEAGSLRNRCWTRVEGGWRPSKAVHRAVQANGYDVAKLLSLGEVDGQVYEFKAVQPGGRIVYTLEKGAKTGH